MFRPCHRDSSGSRPTVLVVDDVDATRNGLAQLLRLRDYAVVEANDGATGIEALRNNPATAVVLLDLAMQGKDGYWFRNEQLRDPMLAHVPVVVFTGSANRERLARLHVADILIKPFSLDHVFTAIARHCAA